LEEEKRQNSQRDMRREKNMKIYTMLMILLLFLATTTEASVIGYNQARDVKVKEIVMNDDVFYGINWNTERFVPSVRTLHQNVDIDTRKRPAPAPVPEPITMILLGTGLLMVGYIEGKRLGKS